MRGRKARLNSVPDMDSMDYLKGFNQAYSEPLKNILAYPNPENDFQRGWNASIKERTER